MGLPLHVRVPGFTAEESVFGLGETESWIEQDGPYGRSVRLQIRVFVQDQPGILREVLAALEDGVKFPAVAISGDYGGFDDERSHPTNTVSFSVESALTSTVRGAFFLAVVARPLGKDRNGGHEGRESALADLVSASILARLRDIDPSTLDDAVHVAPLEAHDNDLFLGRRFTEYRFGVSAQAGHGSQRIAAVLKAFAKGLGKSETPIAYLFFPDLSSIDDSHSIWLRVGVGSPPMIADAIEHDLLANRLAAQHRLRLVKYAPSMTGPLMAQRFVLIADYEADSVNDRQAGACAPTGWEPSMVDAVFVQGKARAGFIGRLLKHIPEEALLGGSMMVMGGYTSSCWVVPRGQGKTTVGSLATRKSGQPQSTQPSGKDPEFDEHHLPRHVSVEAPVRMMHDSDSGAIWVAWTTPEMPGTMRVVVEAIYAYVGGELESIPNIGYAITRVLEGNTLCVGKLKFRVWDSTDSSAIVDCQELEHAVTADLSRFCSAESSAAEHIRVLVHTREPREEPWGSRLP